MISKKIIIFIFILFCISPLKIFAQTNAGFIPSNIWYSVDPFEENNTIKIYTLIFNPDTREFSGDVSFFDDTTLLGKKKFNIMGKMIKDISIDWKVTAGTHNIFAKIENARFLISQNKYEEIYLSESETDKSIRVVEKKIPQSQNIINNKINSVSNTLEDNLKSLSVKNIENKIQNNTPEKIIKSITNTSNTIDKLSNDLKSFSNQQKIKTERDLKKINKNDTFLKPFKYIELFILNIVSFVLQNKITIYIGIIFLLYLICNFLWKIVF